MVTMILFDIKCSSFHKMLCPKYVRKMFSFENERNYVVDKCLQQVQVCALKHQPVKSFISLGEVCFSLKKEKHMNFTLFIIYIYNTFLTVKGMLSSKLLFLKK